MRRPGSRRTTSPIAPTTAQPRRIPPRRRRCDWSWHHLLCAILHHEESFSNTYDADSTVLEERIVVPRSRERRGYRAGVGVEITHFARIERVGDIENAESRL